VTSAELDVRPGGHYSIAFTTADGEGHRVSGEYEEVIEHSKLSFTWAWQSTPDRVSFVTVQLDRDGAGTLMRFRHDRFYDRTALENHTRGWEVALRKFDAYVSHTSGNH
jgi:uncharacterized protein YndB with AHSA1/START domain